MLLAMPAFVVSGELIPLKGNEYHFSSIVCMLYAFTMFVAIERLEIKSCRTISMLSRCFLPVLSYHVLILRHLFNIPYPMYAIDTIISVPIIAFLVEYAIASILIVGIGLIIMKIPYSEKIFRL